MREVFPYKPIGFHAVFLGEKLSKAHTTTIPKIIDRGSIASAILICIGKKLIGANPITNAAYNALIIAINDISLLFIFTPHLPGFAERL